MLCKGVNAYIGMMSFRVPQLLRISRQFDRKGTIREFRMVRLVMNRVLGLHTIMSFRFTGI